MSFPLSISLFLPTLAGHSFWQPADLCVVFFFVCVYLVYLGAGVCVRAPVLPCAAMRDEYSGSPLISQSSMMDRRENMRAREQRTKAGRPTRERRKGKR